MAEPLRRGNLDFLGIRRIVRRLPFPSRLDSLGFRSKVIPEKNTTALKLWEAVQRVNLLVNIVKDIPASRHWYAFCLNISKRATAQFVVIIVTAMNLDPLLP